MATLRQTLEAMGFERNGLGGNLRGYSLTVGSGADRVEYILTAEKDVTRLPCRWDEGWHLTLWQGEEPLPHEGIFQGYDIPDILASYGIAPR